jgi:flagellar motility protein MotE (MotC chaperone)
LINKVLIVIVFSLSLNAAVETSSSLTKQKMEVLELKNELNNFYNEKEKEYQRQKKELEDILTKIEQEKAEIKRLYEKNDEILKDIRAEVVKKSIRIFELMKAKVAAEIFDQMILEGKIEDVFDIIVRLKDSNVSNIMKTMSVENSSRLVQKLERYNKDKQKRD